MHWDTRQCSYDDQSVSMLSSGGISRAHSAALEELRAVMGRMMAIKAETTAQDGEGGSSNDDVEGGDRTTAPSTAASSGVDLLSDEHRSRLQELAEQLTSAAEAVKAIEEVRGGGH